MVQTLAEMTRQPVDAVQAKLKVQHIRTVMQELGIDRQAFRTAMQAKVSEQIKQAAVKRASEGLLPTLQKIFHPV